LISSSECDGFAYDPAKVEDQVQFLARTFTTKTLAVGNFTGLDGLHVGGNDRVERAVGCREIVGRGHGLLLVAIQESSRRSVIADGWSPRYDCARNDSEDPMPGVFEKLPQ